MRVTNFRSAKHSNTVSACISKSLVAIWRRGDRYKEEDELRFPNKHLRALWYSPPPSNSADLPRVFVSELLVEELSQRSQDIILSYLTRVSLVAINDKMSQKC